MFLFENFVIHTHMHIHTRIEMHAYNLKRNLYSYINEIFL